MNDKRIALVDPRRDPRLNPVAESPASLAATEAPDSPPGFFDDPEAPTSGLRLHLAEEAGYDATTEEQMRTLDASEALHRLVDDIGFREVVRILKVIAIAHGETL